MARSTRQILDAARPHVLEVVAALKAEQEAAGAADVQAAERFGVQVESVEAVLQLAEDAVEARQRTLQRNKNLTTVPFDVDVPAALYLRADAGSDNLTREISAGLEKFVAGEWSAVQVVRAAPGQGLAKSKINVRLDGGLVARVQEKADELTEANGWPTKRGYKLTARNVAAQWLARRFPAPDETTESAAE